MPAMKPAPRNFLPALLCTALLAGCANLPPGLDGILGAPASAEGTGGGIGPNQAAQGLKEALQLGTTRAVDRLCVPDGFWLNRDARIPLPESLRGAEKTLRALGQGKTVEDFQLSLNRAAEAAVPEATRIFAAAIRGMSFDDAVAILHGPSNAATQYFRGKTEAELAARFRSTVVMATSRTGATRKYKELSGKLATWAPGFQPEDIDSYVANRAVGSLFTALAQEESRIRRDPAARSTELLKKVFSGGP